MWNKFDLIVVGSGCVGAIVARQAAEEHGRQVLIIEKRTHLGGNCHDYYHPSGVLIHKYGPHYFRTNNKLLLDYLSRFTDWIEGKYYVKSYYQGQLFTLPISITTLEEFYGTSLTRSDVDEFLARLIVPCDNPGNSEELILSKIGVELYEAFYKGYTLKQWEKSPSELDPFVCGRVPVRKNRDPRYVGHKYQLMPKDGYSAMFTNMLEHPNIKILIQSDYFSLKDGIGNVPTVYTGAVDEYFDNCFEPLKWRSLQFKYEVHNQEYVQPCVQINYPEDYNYTRRVEIKHVTGQKHHSSVVVEETPCWGGERYYPFPSPECRSQYERYKELAEKETRENNVFFGGRLAEYKYYDMDVAFERGMAILQDILAVM